MFLRIGIYLWYLGLNKNTIKGGEKKMADVLVGKVIHYFDKIGVAIVRLNKKLSVGDKVKFVQGDDTFEQTVESMQIEHASITEAKTNDEVGIKVERGTKEGIEVFLVS